MSEESKSEKEITQSDASLLKSFADRKPSSELAKSGIAERVQSDVNKDKLMSLADASLLQTIVSKDPNSPIAQSGIAERAKSEARKQQEIVSRQEADKPSPNSEFPQSKAAKNKADKDKPLAQFDMKYISL